MCFGGCTKQVNQRIQRVSRRCGILQFPQIHTWLTIEELMASTSTTLQSTKRQKTN